MTDDRAQSGPIEHWASWADHVLMALREAGSLGGDLHLQDVDFSAWPLGRTEVVQAWHDWALASTRSKAHLLALRCDRLPMQHPRWARWQATRGHRVLIRQLPEDELSSLDGLGTCLVLKGRLALEMSDRESGAGRWTRHPSEVQRLSLKGDANLQRSSDSGGLSTLGL